MYLEGTCQKGEEGMVMMLLRWLYGLKQAPRGWNQHVDDVLKEMGFHRLESDFGLYILGEGPDALYLALYVDGLFLLCIEINKICGVKCKISAHLLPPPLHRVSINTLMSPLSTPGLGERYNMKDLGGAKILLGLEIRRQPNGDFILCQEKYGTTSMNFWTSLACESATRYRHL